MTTAAGKFAGVLVTPIASRVLITEPKRPDKTRSGLLLPDGADHPDDSPVGEVMAVGPDVKQLKVGDRVFLRPDTVAFGKIGRNKQMGFLVDEGVVLGSFVPDPDAAKAL